MQVLADHKKWGDDSGWGLREIEPVDSKCLRMFFLSLLWRAASSSLREFADITIPDDDLEQVRLLILANDVGKIDFYPATLIQLSTVGVVHNHTPMNSTKTTPQLNDENPERQIPFIRFYFDGLIAHVHRHASDDGHTSALKSLIVGGDSKLAVTTVTYERSTQKEILDGAMLNTEW